MLQSTAMPDQQKRAFKDYVSANFTYGGMAMWFMFATVLIAFGVTGIVIYQFDDNALCLYVIGFMAITAAIPCLGLSFYDLAIHYKVKNEHYTFCYGKVEAVSGQFVYIDGQKTRVKDVSAAYCGQRRVVVKVTFGTLPDVWYSAPLY